MGDRLVDQFISLVTENTDKVEKFNFEKDGSKVTLSVTVDTKVKSKEDKVSVDVKTTSTVTDKPKVKRVLLVKEEKKEEVKPVAKEEKPAKKPRVKKVEPKLATEVKEKKTRKTKVVDHTGDPEVDIIEVKEEPKKTRKSKTKKEESAGPWKYDVVSGNFVQV